MTSITRSLIRRAGGSESSVIAVPDRFPADFAPREAQPPTDKET